MTLQKIAPVRSWLYTPGNNERRLQKAVTLGADAVIFDLEDAVPEGEKNFARRLVAQAVEVDARLSYPLVFVRVNHRSTGLQEADLNAVVRSGLAGVRLPKIESAEEVRFADAVITAVEEREGLAPGGVVIVCNIESARGVWNAGEIAAASPRVLALAFGAVDFARDVGATVGRDRRETAYARSHLVLASRVAGIRPPIEGVHTDLDDEDGLVGTTQEARALGFFGRSAIHPKQVPVINATFTPTEDEIDRAREIVNAAGEAASAGQGAIRLASGEFVDAAVVRRANDVLRLAAAIAEVAA